MSLSHDALLMECLLTLRSALPKGGGALEEILTYLDFLTTTPNQDLLDLSLRILDGGKVTRVRSHSHCEFWQVCSSLESGESSSTSSSSGGKESWGASGVTPSISGSGEPVYTVLLDGPGLCTCLEFKENVEAGGEGRLCRHFLAALIGDACGEALATVHHVRLRDVGDEEARKALEKALCGGGGGRRGR